jgi:hypothetical protein
MNTAVAPSLCFERDFNVSGMGLPTHANGALGGRFLQSNFVKNLNSKSLCRTTTKMHASRRKHRIALNLAGDTMV